jgi:hypothetical protein
MTTEATPAPKFAVSTSPTIGAIAKALAAAQLEMGPAIKDRVGNIPGKDGKQGYQYTYATLATCFEAIQPLHKNGIAVTQIPLDGGNGVLVATLLMHESGEWIRGELWMPVAQNTPQGYGSALTYNRRYSLQLLCGLASDDDDGEDGSRGNVKPQPRSAARPTPAKTQAAPPDLGVFASLCERIDVAETGSDLDAIARGAQKAHRDGVITDSHLEQIKAAGARKRGVIGAPATANGGAS